MYAAAVQLTTIFAVACPKTASEYNKAELISSPINWIRSSNDSMTNRRAGSDSSK